MGRIRGVVRGVVWWDGEGWTVRLGRDGDRRL